MKKTKQSLWNVIGMMAAVTMLSIPSFGVSVEASDNSFSNGDTPDSDVSSRIRSRNGSRVAYVRIPVVGNAIGGIAANDITSASLDVYIEDNGDADTVRIYVLNNDADYDGAGTDYLSETTWTGGTIGANNITSTNMPHGPFLVSYQLVVSTADAATPDFSGTYTTTGDGIFLQGGNAIWKDDVGGSDSINDTWWLTSTNDIGNTSNAVGFANITGAGEVGTYAATNTATGTYDVAADFENSDFAGLMTLVGSRRYPGSPTTPDGQYDNRGDEDNLLRGNLVQIPITELAAFKAAVNSDDNNEITFIVIPDNIEDAGQTEFNSTFDINQPKPQLTVASGADTTAPAPPANFVVTDERDASVTLEWDPVVEAAEGLYIYRSDTSGSYGSPLATLDYWEYTYTDTTVDNESTYYYALVAFDAAANASSLTNEVVANTAADTNAPAAPANVSAIGSDGEVSVIWQANTEDDLASYNVYRATTSGGYGPTPLTNVTDNSYIDTDVTNGVTYYYVITAIDDSLAENESDQSMEASATPDKPSLPSGVILFGSDNEGLAGFVPSNVNPLDTGAVQGWSVEPASVRHITNDPDWPTVNVDPQGGTRNSSLLREFPLLRANGMTYTIEGVVNLTDGYGDDNNRVGLYLFGDVPDLVAGPGENESGALGLLINTDDNGSNTNPVYIAEGIDGTKLAGVARVGGVAQGDTLIGTELTFTADITFTNVSDTNYIDVVFSLTDASNVTATVGTTVLAADYTGDYCGFATRARNRGITSSDRAAPWTMDYKSFSISTDLSGYEVWAFGWESEIGPGTADFDLDGVDNLNEYGTDGNPTNANDVGYASYLTADGIYIHAQRNDDPDLTYTIQTTLDLVTGIWSDETPPVAGTDVDGRKNGVDIVTNTVGTAEDEKFIRLKIEY